MDKREAPPIGRDEVLQAAQTLREYKNGKSALERRIVANEQWWKLRHWQQTVSYTHLTLPTKA